MPLPDVTCERRRDPPRDIAMRSEQKQPARVDRRRYKGAYDDISCGNPGSWEWLSYGATPLRMTCNYVAARGRQVFGMFVYFLKRSLDRPLGSFVLRYGATGNEENFIDADAPPASGDHLDETFTPTRDGELYVYLNKPALGVWPNVAYNLNSGIAKVTVIRIPLKP